ncbi:MAG: hypothetical protein WCO58_00995 [bacterium]
MKNILLCSLLFVTFQIHAQRLNHYPEVSFAPKSTTPLFGYDLMYLKPKKGSIGGWGFVYGDKNSFEAVIGPALMKKEFACGVGAGYEIISRSPVIATFVNYFTETNEVYAYIEKGKTWYWYQILLNRNFGKDNQWIACLYSQTGIGTGAKIGHTIGQKMYISAGGGYDKDHWSPVVSLGATFEK